MGHTDNGLELDITTASLNPTLAQEGSLLDFSQWEYVPINRARGEAIGMSVGASATFTGLGPIILLSNYRRSEQTHMAQVAWGPVILTRTWFDGAELTRVDWQGRGSYAITSTCCGPDTPAVP